MTPICVPGGSFMHSRVVAVNRPRRCDGIICRVRRKHVCSRPREYGYSVHRCLGIENGPEFVVYHFLRGHHQAEDNRAQTIYRAGKSSIWDTRLHELEDMGIGVALYFQFLKVTPPETMQSTSASFQSRAQRQRKQRPSGLISPRTNDIVWHTYRPCPATLLCALYQWVKASTVTAPPEHRHVWVRLLRFDAERWTFPGVFCGTCSLGSAGD